MNPYKTLKVRKNASKDAIQKAFRKLVLKAHPDTGGDAKTFQEVHLAYKVLMDDARRAHYDATGEIQGEQPDQSISNIMGVLAPIFQQLLCEVIRNGGNPKSKNFVQMMRQTVTQLKQAAEQQRTQLHHARKMLQETLGRFTIDDEPENVMEGMVINQIALVERELKPVEETLAAQEKALEFLKRCKFKSESPAGTATAASPTTFIQFIQRQA